MGNTAKQVIDSIKKLSAGERAAIAQLLIASLDKVPETGTELAWMSLAEARLAELESGKVQAVSWREIKEGLK